MNTNILNKSIEVKDELVLGYITSFKTAFSKTAKSILDIGRVVVEAKNKLSKDQYKVFAFQIGFETTSPTLLKLIKIGERYDDLIGKVDLLPANWTTLYDIAQLPAQQFEKCVDDGLIQPNVLGKEIKPLLPSYKSDEAKATKNIPNGSDQETTGQYKFTVILGGYPDQATVQKLKKIIDECKSIKSAEVELSTLEEFFASDVVDAQAA